MNFLKKVLGITNEAEIAELTAGYCPNCWGDQEYANEIREKYKDPQIDVNNHQTKYAFVQDFMVTHLDGIKLRSTEGGKGCPRCRMKA